MERKLTIEVREPMSDYDFIELGFLMQERFFRPGVFRAWANGDFIFRFPQGTFVLRAGAAGAQLLDAEARDGTPVVLDLRVNDEATWIRIAQKLTNPLAALLRGDLQILAGGLRGFLLYGLCFVKPHCGSRVELEKEMAAVPPIDRIRNVVVFTASPRKFGATRLYLKRFVAGMERAGAQVRIVDLYEKDIKPCRGCFTCWLSTPGRCIYEDDMADIIREVEDCDLWVLSFPTYCGGIPSGLQKALERCLRFVHPHNAMGRDGLARHPRRHKPHHQYMAALNVFGFSERTQSEHLDAHMRDIAEHASFDYLGMARVPNCIAKALNRQEERTLESDFAILEKLGYRLVSDKRMDHRLAKQLNARSPFRLDDTYHSNSVFLELMVEQNCRPDAVENA